MPEVDNNWIIAVAAVAAGITLGAVAGWLARRWLSNARRRPAVRAVAVPASIFLFWLAVATGILFAVGSTSPDSLRPIPRNIIDWIPNVLVAGLLILAGSAAGIGFATTVGRALNRATGRSNPGVERLIRWTVLGGAIVLALGQLGVQTTILVVLIAGLVAAVGLTFALLAGLGGREVAGHIAASRTLRSELVPGHRIVAAGVAGTIVVLNATTLVIATDDGRRMLIPYALLLSAPFEVTPAVEPER